MSQNDTTAVEGGEASCEEPAAHDPVPGPGGTVSGAPTRVRDLVRDVVTDVAPEELPLVAGLFLLDDSRAVRRLSARDRRRESLGFGLGEVAALITPVVWLAVDQAAQQIMGTWVDHGIARMGTAVRRLFRRSGPEPVTVPPLTRRQLRFVHESVLTMAAQRGLEPGRAAVIADAVVARLAVAEAEADERPRLPGSDGPEGSGRPDAS
ncbi:hypothetical protein ACIP5L_07240 [Streptomyces bacillaris]|uniref:hypothetical protein n=1 Tax=Streptomyces bacillaris TaxID=68179 RepID=UPI0038209A53